MKKFNSVIDISNYLVNLKNKNKDIKLKFMIGNGDKKQYKDRKELEEAIESISKRPGKNSVFLYFGDVPKKDAPDIGYAYEYLAKIRPDIIFIMIQIKEMEKYGVPKFVNGGVYFHNDYDEKHKWGGFEKVNGKLKVYSNTKQWLKLHLLFGINHIITLGEDGPISKQEMDLIDYLIDYNKDDISLTHIDYLESKY
jgi:hypothetical protein